MSPITYFVGLLLLGVALTFSAGCTRGQVTPATVADAAPSVLRGAALALEALTSESPFPRLLRLALNLLREGDLPGCCEALRLHLEQFGRDPQVRAVLDIVEDEIS